MKAFVWISLVLWACSPLAAQEFSFESGEYETLRDLAEAIIKPHIGQKFVVVAPGRSPAPISAYLQEAHPEILTVSVPATKLKNLNPKIEPELLEKIFLHFDHYIPLDKIPPDATIVVPDHTESAMGVRKLKELLQAWLKARGRTNEVETVAISYKGPVGFDTSHVVESVDRVVNYGSPAQLKRFASERYDAFAEVGEAPFWEWKHKPGENYIRPARQEYMILRNAMREKVGKRQRSYYLTLGALRDFCSNTLARLGIGKY